MQAWCRNAGVPACPHSLPLHTWFFLTALSLLTTANQIHAGAWQWTQRRQLLHEVPLRVASGRAWPLTHWLVTTAQIPKHPFLTFTPTALPPLWISNSRIPSSITLLVTALKMYSLVAFNIFRAFSSSWWRKILKVRNGCRTEIKSRVWLYYLWKHLRF